MRNAIASKCVSFALSVATVSCVVFAATACRQARSPVVRVDQAHYLWRDDAKPYEVYQVPAGSEITLDAAGYTFDTSQFANQFDPNEGWTSDVEPVPNLIQLVVGLPEDAAEVVQTAGELNVYRAAWQPDTQIYALNAQTLTPVAESEPFGGVKPGQRIIIEIGRIETQESTKEELFYSFWSGMVEVQP